MHTTIDEILALDRIALSEYIDDFERHIELLQKLFPASQVCPVRRNGRLVAYTMMHKEENGTWFVTAFNTLPEHRSAPVLQELFVRFSMLANKFGITELRSSVYKTNRLSLSLHGRLGFRVAKESNRKLEFRTTVVELTASLSSSRLGRKLGTNIASE